MIGQKIENQYNPEFDVPATPLVPQVTWTDMELLVIIRQQAARIDSLEARLERVTDIFEERFARNEERYHRPWGSE